jgi:FtsP/CotA-like multicopper oxidase with cupredoxin domain
MLDLPILNLHDFSKLSINDKVKIEIVNTTHSFYPPDSSPSGMNYPTQPIFGSNFYINDELITYSSFGLPALLFKKGIRPFINFVNNTNFTTNIHFHGLDVMGNLDGVSSFEIFGENTTLGTSVNCQFPVIQNNSSLLWYHSHPPFRSAQLAYAGIAGIVVITDTISEPLNDQFVYGKNYFVLSCQDMDFDSSGCQVLQNIPTFVNRSCFTVINGLSTVQWYTDPSLSVPYSTILSQNTTNNIVKIDFLNPNSNWRVLYLGLCDSNNNLVNFYVIQTDQGICQPVYTNIQFIPIGGRISILVDLTDMKNAFLFFYDFDLTEIVDNNSDSSFVIPDFSNTSSTPYPSPITDPINTSNQQSYNSKLTYPHVSLINQVNTSLTYGFSPIPNTYSKRPFLYLNNNSEINDMSMNAILSIINNIIFKNGIPPTDTNDYLKSLNPDYYYNIPDVTTDTPNRNVVMLSETNYNNTNSDTGNKYLVGKDGTVNFYGLTEFCTLARRIYSDLWNSNQLDINYAINEYIKSPNNYKPNILPTSNFRVVKTDDQYINIAGISNDNFIIECFQNDISYNSISSSPPIFSFSITLQETPRIVNLNIQEWVDYLNNALAGINITSNEKIFLASNILTFDWSFFPYGVMLLNGTTQYIKTAVIKIKNNTNYYIKITGRWSLLQLMGKCMTGRLNLTPPLENSGPCCSTDSPCDEYMLYNVYDNYIQTFYPYYATNIDSKPIGILCPRRNAELIIGPLQSNIGLYTGFDNENLDSFTVQYSSSEIWTYLNADPADSHPLHMHMTSGFSYQKLSLINNIPNTPGSNTIPGLTNIFSRDIYQIGPQQSISFALKWVFYSSLDTTDSPYLPNIGGVVHCHYLAHSDLNTMMLSYQIKPLSNLISNICFPAGTPIKTDQGDIPIETIVPNIHTICNKKIIEITKTISLDDCLVCFEKNSLGKDIPSKTTILSKKHKIAYNGKMIEAELFVGRYDNIYKIKYDGQILYNVLMENYDTILVNNITCETLHPQNNIAKIYKSFNNLNSLDCEKIVKQYNSNYSKKLSSSFDKTI